ncbi:MAG: hypothetical protein K2O39_00735, partial [Clostridiales bacterium]|nr:hypothetical protein [Clostridiales bacterium]
GTNKVSLDSYDAYLEEQTDGRLHDFGKADITFNKDDVVTFTVDGTAIDFYLDGFNKETILSLVTVDNADAKNTSVTIKANGTYAIYLKEYASGWVLNILGEVDDPNPPTPPQPGESKFYLYGTVGGVNKWNTTNGYEFVEIDPDEDEVLAKKYKVELSAGDEVKIFKTNTDQANEWSFNNYEEGCLGDNINWNDGGNLLVGNDGTFTFYLKIGTDGGSSVWVHYEGEDDPNPPTPSTPVITLTNGSTAITVVDNSANIAATETAKYEFKLSTGTIALNQGDVLTLLVNGESPAPKFGGRNTNHGVEISGNKINVMATGTFTFYLRFYEDNNWWEVEMTDGETDPAPTVGDWYLVGTLSNWNCNANYHLGTTGGTITEKWLEAGTKFKVAKCKDATGAPNWTVANYGYGNVTQGLGYVNNAGGDIEIKADGHYTITFDGTNIKITSSDVEEDTNTPYSAKVMLADGKKVTLIFNMPQDWGLSATELNSCNITINNTKTVNIKSNGAVELDASDIALGKVTIKVAFKQGGATKNGTMQLDLEDGATYMLNWGAPWSGDVFTLTANKLA